MISHRAGVISALGIVEIFAWGSTFYLLAVLAEPIIADTGWSRTVVTGGISLGLLVAGAVAIRVGSLIQRHGGRPVLASAMALIAAGLALLAAAPNVAVYLCAWILLGVGMGAGLYDAAFAALGRLYGRDARRAITALTLWGGFASTVCWPISALLVESIGWRGTCLSYVALHLTVTLPLCLILPRAEPPLQSKAASRSAPASSPLRDPKFWLLALAGTTLAMIASLWSVHLISIMQAHGLTLAAAVALGTLIGPAQVGARVVEMLSGGRHHPIWTMLAATLLVAAGFAGLRAGVPASAAVVAYGAGNGIWSITRGAMPLSLFGPDDYPAIIGLLAAPALIASAFGPAVGAVVIERFGAEGALALLAGAALLPVLCAILVFVLLRRNTPLSI
ncbi:MFS transporter [Roseitranquillus sediminis]|uniref:MFS transporter n=1 Tax=Roseitranquillus sediminis TaxID=2809051 RepID=UPI001D0BFADC|nr:MFS transporter [Roseitranquillus sediminis]MBM9593584.1 MFS transporter [Roseitranquillus sediminis]